MEKDKYDEVKERDEEQVGTKKQQKRMQSLWHLEKKMKLTQKEGGEEARKEEEKEKGLKKSWKRKKKDFRHGNQP